MKFTYIRGTPFAKLRLYFHKGTKSTVNTEILFYQATRIALDSGEFTLAQGV